MHGLSGEVNKDESKNKATKGRMSRNAVSLFLRHYANLKSHSFNISNTFTQQASLDDLKKNKNKNKQLNLRSNGFERSRLI